MSKKLILENLCSRFDLNPSEVSYSMNLFKGAIDSLDFLEYAKAIETIALKEGFKFDIKDFLYSECYSVDEIFTYLENLKKVD